MNSHPDQLDHLDHLVLTATLLLASACAHAPPAASPSAAPAPFTVRGQPAEVVEGVTTIRAATARFASLDSAVAVGYPHDSPQCYANGTTGAMGYHHVNRGYVDAQLDLAKPEILLYERHPDGRYTLSAVEFIIPYTRWPADSTAPVLLGVHLKRYDDLRIWSVHMWVWKENPSGLFADWNPRVQCPGAAAAMTHN